MMRLLLTVVVGLCASCVPEEIPCFVDQNCPSETPFCVPGNICSDTSPFDADGGVSDVEISDAVN